MCSKNVFNKFLCTILATLFIFSCAFTAFADENENESSTTEPTTASESTTKKEESTTKKSEGTTLDTKKKNELDSKRKELQKKIEENNKTLLALSKKSTDTVEYMTALDTRIGYLNDELTILQKEADNFATEISTVEKAIKTTEKDLKKSQKDFDKVQKELNELNEKFASTYEKYCLRLRAMYISGTTSIIGFLLESNDISSFLTRYEMIKSVSENDTSLLKEIDKQEKDITSEKSEYQKKKKVLDAKKAKLDKEKSVLASSKAGLESRQTDIAKTKAQLVDDMNKSDNILYELNKKDYKYTEYKWKNQQEADKIEAELNGTLDEYLNAHKDDKFVYDGGVKYNNKNKTDSVLNMTYPVPGHYGVSATFGNHGYSSGGFHGGIDFPCTSGSNVVAAQAGTVVYCQQWNGSRSGMQSYGNMVMIYHGTDAKGRTVATVYAHNSSLLVRVGDTVRKGQVIAHSGTTGNSTGPHCHFEVRIDGNRVNPQNYLAR